ncbi:MAG TPA: hypothetical protein VMV95_02925 [Bacillota bacterium]|nr:hypothetical protein [Bacillota bacterium]
MSWVEPLELETIFIQIFAGDATYFSALAIFAILALASYFRMNAINMGFMIMIFLLMFSGYVPATLLIFVSIFAGLLVGYVMARVMKN